MRTQAKQALAWAVIASTLLMLAVAYYSPIQETYHPLNTDWNGCSELVSVADNVTLISPFSTRELMAPSLLTIIGPSLEFSTEDALQILEFMNRNGTVLLADDFGTGNNLLQKLNVSVRFAGKPLADLAFFSKDRSFPIVFDFSPSPLTFNLTAVVLNHPSYLEIGNASSAIPIGFSSPFSFVDVNGTGLPYQNETIQAYPVMAVAKIGNGTVIMISSANMFTNEMIQLYDNMQLFQNALKMGGGVLLFDEVHLYRAPLTDARIALKDGIDFMRRVTGGTPLSQAVSFLVVASVMMIALFMIRRRTKTKTPTR